MFLARSEALKYRTPCLLWSKDHNISNKGFFVCFYFVLKQLIHLEATWVARPGYALCFGLKETCQAALLA